MVTRVFRKGYDVSQPYNSNLFELLALSYTQCMNIPLENYSYLSKQFLSVYIDP